jgi:hypothetical protein
MQIIQKQIAMDRPCILVVADVEGFALLILDIHLILGSNSLREV